MKRPTETQLHYDERIVQYIEGGRININGIYEDVERKREFVRDVLGYSRLRVGKNEFLPLSQCNDTRISVVAKQAYSSAKKRLEETVQSIHI
jgi:hypothetical protein